MATARPVAPTQPHLARLRVDRQHRLIEELRLAGGRHATAEALAAALRVDVRSVERDIARLRQPASPSPPAAAPAAASASTSPRSTSPPARSPP
jgi:HTH domain